MEFSKKTTKRDEKTNQGSLNLNVDKSIKNKVVEFPCEMNKDEIKYYNAGNILFLGLLINEDRNIAKQIYEEIFSVKDEIEININLKPNDINNAPSVISNNIADKTLAYDIYPDNKLQEYTSKKLRLNIISLYKQQYVRTIFNNFFETQEKKELIQQFVLKFIITSSDYYKYMSGTNETLSSIILVME